MATIQLADGREIPIVKPHIGDQMDLERQMRAIRPKYGPTEFRDDLKLVTFQTAFAIFASFRRAGIETSIQEVFELDLGELGQVLKREPGDGGDDEIEPAAESEGEQSGDPQSAPTGDAAEPVLKRHLSLID